MLFISRIIAQGPGTPLSYGVVDDEDWVEEILPHLSIAKLSGNVKIEGCQLLQRTGSHMRPLGRIDVYQHPSFVTKELMKFKMLTGIDLVIYRDMIVKISWDSNKIKLGIQVVLSKFAKSCGDDILFYKPIAVGGGNHLTFVLDNSLSFTECTFNIMAPIHSVLADFDLRQLGDRKAKVVYDALSWSFADGGDPWHSYIIDDEKRKSHFVKLCEFDRLRSS